MSGFAGVPNFRDIETSPCPCTQSNRSLCKHVTTGDLASRSFSSRPHLLPYPSRQLIKHERIRLAAGESLVWCLEATSSTTLATCLNTSSHSPSEASWLWGMFQAKKIVHCVTTRKLIGIISTHLKNMSEHENFPQAVEIEHQNMLKKKQGKLLWPNRHSPQKQEPPQGYQQHFFDSESQVYLQALCLYAGLGECSPRVFT